MTRHFRGGDRRHDLGRRLTADRRHDGPASTHASVERRTIGERRSGSDRRSGGERRSAAFDLPRHPGPTG